MIFNLLNGGNSLFETTIILIIAIIILPLSLSFHEFSHALISYAQGDTLAKRRNRLTLNPLSHLDIFGTISMLLFGIGWAKPVPINPSAYKNPKFGFAITAIFGPISNFILGIVFISINSFIIFLMSNNVINIGNNAFVLIYNVLYYSSYYNFLLCFFNMIPIPPFDGSRLLLAFLPSKYYFSVMKYERILMIILLILIISDRFTLNFQGLITFLIDRFTNYIYYFYEFIF